MTATESKGLLDDKLVELLDLVQQADSIELKLTVPETAQRSAIRALDVDPLNAQIRQVFFFDTPDLALNGAGVVVRARRIQGRGDDSVIKLRPVVPDQLSEKLRRTRGFVVEVDAIPTGYVCSGSMKGKLPTAPVRAALAGQSRLSKLFSKEQRAFFAEHAPAGIELDGLSVLGPIFVLKVNFVPPGYGRKLVGEMWLYPDGSRIVELSTKCLPGEGLSVAREVRDYLAGVGIDLSGEQQTKTKTALEFFSQELRGDATT